jgi:hypothetical protein
MLVMHKYSVLNLTGLMQQKVNTEMRHEGSVLI